MEFLDKLTGKAHRKAIILMYHHYHKPAGRHIKRLSEIAPDFDVVIADNANLAIDAAPYAEIIFGNRFMNECITYAKNLKWIQTTSGGFDQLPLDKIKERGAMLSRNTIGSKVIARHAHTMAWALVRQLPQTFLNQMRRKWSTDIKWIPEPKIALILGFGCIGRELARLLKADGIKVLGVKKRYGQLSQDICDKLFTATEPWREELRDVDMCFLTLPLNQQTRNILGKKELEALSNHAIIVNVSRGGILDEYALVKLLKDGRLGGAGLDVSELITREGDDAIWGTPNLIITPHVAAHHFNMANNIEEFFEKQLSRYLNNEQIENLVDLKES